MRWIPIPGTAPRTGDTVGCSEEAAVLDGGLASGRLLPVAGSRQPFPFARPSVARSLLLNPTAVLYSVLAILK